MKQIHNITITVFIKEDEDKELTTNTILKFLGEDLEEQKIEYLKTKSKKIFEKEKINVEENFLKAEYGDNITKIVIKSEKEKNNKQIISKLKEILGEQQIKQLKEEENRVDENGFFYLRISRDEFENNNIAKLTDKGNCFHFKIMIAAFPKTREKAIEVVKNILE